MPQVLAKTPRDRDSNMELLRIVSMLLVLVVHAGFRALSVPTPAEAVAAPGSTLLRFFSESASIICVNVFVLLSGWYGIRFRLLRLAEFLFQVLFFVVVGFALYSLLFGFPGFRFSVLSSLLLSDRWDYWFVKCYLGLYLFAPVLNAFAERVPRSAFRLFLVSFFLFQTVYGWLMPSGAEPVWAYPWAPVSALPTPTPSSFWPRSISCSSFPRLVSGAAWSMKFRCPVSPSIWSIPMPFWPIPVTTT